ncbi:hypothetical protein JXB31_00090 [Candidatus Woesearchaeota archaeon]|nr:hypothetical protein [Candidatus Woesearchaeota archaeon]
MKKRVIFLAILVSIALLFVIAGMPLLRYLKAHADFSIFDKKTEDKTADSASVGNSTFGGREITLDITVEDICSNPITGEIELECSNPDACRATCMNRGCMLFGLEFVRSEFKGNRCYCICYEENKIKKALSQG